MKKNFLNRRGEILFLVIILCVSIVFIVFAMQTGLIENTFFNVDNPSNADDNNDNNNDNNNGNNDNNNNNNGNNDDNPPNDDDNNNGDDTNVIIPPSVDYTSLSFLNYAAMDELSLNIEKNTIICNSLYLNNKVIILVNGNYNYNTSKVETDTYISIITFNISTKKHTAISIIGSKNFTYINSFIMDDNVFIAISNDDEGKIYSYDFDKVTYVNYLAIPFNSAIMMQTNEYYTIITTNNTTLNFHIFSLTADYLQSKSILIENGYKITNNIIIMPDSSLFLTAKKDNNSIIISLSSEFILLKSKIIANIYAIYPKYKDEMQTLCVITTNTVTSNIAYYNLQLEFIESTPISHKLVSYYGGNLLLQNNNEYFLYKLSVFHSSFTLANNYYLLKQDYNYIYFMMRNNELSEYKIAVYSLLKKELSYINLEKLPDRINVTSFYSLPEKINNISYVLISKVKKDNCSLLCIDLIR